MVLVALAIVMALSTTHTVVASHLDSQINALQEQSSDTQQAQDTLELEAGSYKEKIAQFNEEIQSLQRQIDDTKRKSDELAEEIAKTEASLRVEQDRLGAAVRALYMNDQISMLEMLATSNNLSEFFDKQTYITSVQRKIKEALDNITTLKQELQEQKDSLDKLMTDQKSVQARLRTQQKEQDHLLALNQAQQATYNRELQQTNSRIQRLKQEQAAENAWLGGGSSVNNSGSGYPWASVPYPSSSPDPWGMYKRECVSYTAWKVANSGRYMPYWGGRGNAKQWDDNARAAGIPVDYSPRVGDVGVSNSGTYGHTFYVEKVSGDGSIYVSDYNQQFDGKYREYWITASIVRARGLVFIHFP